MKIVQENTGRKETEFDPAKREQETAEKISVRKKVIQKQKCLWKIWLRHLWYLTILHWKRL